MLSLALIAFRGGDKDPVVRLGAPRREINLRAFRTKATRYRIPRVHNRLFTFRTQPVNGACVSVML